MNSALQCFYNTKFIREFLLSEKYVSYINCGNLLGRQGKIITAFAKLVFYIFNI